MRLVNTHPVLMALLLAATSACGPHGGTASSLQVTNGIVAGNAFPAVVKLKIREAAGVATCTGTFVNDAQVITAAHCVYPIYEAGFNASNILFELPIADGWVPIHADRYVFSDKYHEVPGSLSNNDLAVVTFARGAAPAVLPMYKSIPTVGQKFIIVGFGANDYALDGSKRYSGVGIKRAGTNVIKSFRGNLIQFVGIPVAQTNLVRPGEFSSSGAGDSGGPLLIDGALAGVTSGGGLRTIRTDDGQAWQMLESDFVSVNVPETSAFLRNQLTFGWH